MNEKKIIDRIERLEELALLTHGTLDVDQVKAQLKATAELQKEMHKELDDIVEKGIKRIDFLRSQLSRPLKRS